MSRRKSLGQNSTTTVSSGPAHAVRSSLSPNYRVGLDEVLYSTTTLMLTKVTTSIALSVCHLGR